MNNDKSKADEAFESDKIEKANSPDDANLTINQTIGSDTSEAVHLRTKCAKMEEELDKLEIHFRKAKNKILLLRRVNGNLLLKIYSLKEKNEEITEELEALTEEHEELNGQHEDLSEELEESEFQIANMVHERIVSDLTNYCLSVMSLCYSNSNEEVLKNRLSDFGKDLLLKPVRKTFTKYFEELVSNVLYNSTSQSHKFRFPLGCLHLWSINRNVSEKTFRSLKRKT